MTAQFSVFSTITGEFLRSGSCPSSLVAQQAGVNEVVLPHSADGLTNYLSGGELRTYTQTQSTAKAQTPEHASHWDNTTMRWVDLRSLAEHRAEKWEQVKVWRSMVIDATMQTPYGQVQCRTEDRQNIASAVLLAKSLAELGHPTSVDWTMADNRVVTLDLSELTHVGVLLGQKVQAAHAVARELRTQIDEATSATQIDAVIWP